MRALEIQNWLTMIAIGISFIAILASLYIAWRSGEQSKKALSVDINFRALDKRKELFTELERALVLFTDELDSDGNVYPLLKDSEIYDLQIYGEEENPTGPSNLDLGDMLRLSENTLQLLQEAALIFPKAKKKIEDLCKQLSKFMGVQGTNNNKEFIREQKRLKDTSKRALGLMKEYLDISQFPNLGY